MAKEDVIPAGMPIPGPGRKSGYDQKFNDQARKLCLLGYIDAELASFFGIAESTLNRWKDQFPAFREAINAGKVAADAEVADSLYQRATGHQIVVERLVKGSDGSHDVVTLKQFVPGDVHAQRLWLLNRRKGNWRDKQEVEHSVSGELADRLMRARASRDT